MTAGGDRSVEIFSLRDCTVKGLGMHAVAPAPSTADTSGSSPLAVITRTGKADAPGRDRIARVSSTPLILGM